MKRKDYPPGQDDARRAKTLGPFPSELWQPTSVGYKKGCKKPISCLPEWTGPFLYPTGNSSDKISLDESIDGGVYGLLITYISSDSAAFDSTLGVGAWYQVLTKYSPTDLASMDSTVGPNCFQSPRPTTVYDFVKLDSALISSSYVEVVVIAPSLTDSMTDDTSLQSGTYTLTVVGPVSAPTDSVTIDDALASASYILVVVVAPSITDAITQDGTLGASSFDQRVFGTASAPTDKLTFDVALATGSYS